jgi:hypothetical protein
MPHRRISTPTVRTPLGTVRVFRLDDDSYIIRAATKRGGRRIVRRLRLSQEAMQAVIVCAFRLSQCPLPEQRDNGGAGA